MAVTEDSYPPIVLATIPTDDTTITEENGGYYSKDLTEPLITKEEYSSGYDNDGGKMNNHGNKNNNHYDDDDNKSYCAGDCWELDPVTNKMRRRRRRRFRMAAGAVGGMIVGSIIFCGPAGVVFGGIAGVAGVRALSKRAERKKDEKLALEYTTPTVESHDVDIVVAKA